MSDRPEGGKPGSVPPTNQSPPSSLDRPPPGWPSRGWGDRLGGLLGDPAVLRPVFWVLRHVAPVLKLGGRVVVSRHDDVVDVLRRDQDFTIAEVNATRMERWSGAFILGFDRGADYDREAGALHRAAPDADLGRIRDLVVGEARDLIDAARPLGRIDVVGGYARIVATRVVGTYLGAPGPGDAATRRWMRALFDEVFVDDSARARKAATLTVAEQRPYMEALIAARRAAVIAGEPVPDDVLTRLVTMGVAGPSGPLSGVAGPSGPSSEPWLDDDAVRRNLNGLIVGALDTTSKAVAHVVDELLRHPGALAATQRAALAGDLEAVRGYAWEALRFRPHGPVLERHCARETTLGRRNTRIPAGSTVLVSTMSAMFDPAAFPEPRRILPDRPPERYLHFGTGMHACFGRHINGVQIPELVAALARLPGLRRAPGGEGRLVYDGPFPDRLIVEFDSPRAT